jgi:hypothetical protein
VSDLPDLLNLPGLKVIHPGETATQGDKALNSDVGAAVVTRAQGAATLDTDKGKADVKKAGGFLNSGAGGS